MSTVDITKSILKPQDVNISRALIMLCIITLRQEHVKEIRKLHLQIRLECEQRVEVVL